MKKGMILIVAVIAMMLAVGGARGQTPLTLTTIHVLDSLQKSGLLYTDSSRYADTSGFASLSGHASTSDTATYADTAGAMAALQTWCESRFVNVAGDTLGGDLWFLNNSRTWFAGSDSSFIYQSGDRADWGMRHDATNYVLMSIYWDRIIASANLLIENSRLIITDATGADSASIWDDGDTTRFESDNPIKIGDASLIVEKGGDISVSGALKGADGRDIFARLDTLVGYIDTTTFTPQSYVEYFVGDTNTASIVNATGVAIGWGNYIDALAHQSYVMGQACSTFASWQTILGFRNVGGAEAKYATIGGGYRNTVEAQYATVSGGSSNSVESKAFSSNVAGGFSNKVTSSYSGVLSGSTNQVGGSYSVVTGGNLNTIDNANYSAILGGYNNVIGSTADFSLVFGRSVDVGSDDYLAQFYSTAYPGILRVGGRLEAINDTLDTVADRDSSAHIITVVDTTCYDIGFFTPQAMSYMLCGESGSGDAAAIDYSVGTYHWLYQDAGGMIIDSFVVIVITDGSKNFFAAVYDTVSTIDVDTVLVANTGNSYFRNVHGFYSTWDSLAADLINATTAYVDSFTFAWAFGGDIDVNKLTSGDSLYIEGNFAHIPRLSNDEISIGSPSTLTYFGVSADHDTLYFEVEDGGVTVRFGIVPESIDTLP